MCSRSQLNVSDKNKNIANLWQTANLIHIQLPMHAQPFTKLQNRSQWFLRIKPIDMSCSKKWKLMQSSWQLTKLLTLSSTSPSSVQSEIVQNSEIPRRLKIVIPLQSQLDSSFITAFCISPRSCRRLPSLALPPGLESLQKNLYIGRGPAHSDDLVSVRGKLVQQVAILVEFQSLHSALPNSPLGPSGVQSLKYCARSTAAIGSFRSPNLLEYSSGWISLPLFKSSNCLGVRANQRRMDSIAVDANVSRSDR